MVDDSDHKNPSDPLAEAPKQEEPVSQSSLTPPETSDKPQEPQPLSRRDLITTVPKVALGSLLAMEQDKALAFHPGLFFKSSARPEIYGLWAFGYNAYGQLGLGDVVHRSRPVQVGTLNSWVDVTGGGRRTLARRFET